MKIVAGAMLICFMFVLFINVGSNAFRSMMVPNVLEEFNKICEEHYNETLKDGAFTTADQDRLRLALENENFTVVSMQPVVNVGWGDELNFVVEGTYTASFAGQADRVFTCRYENSSMLPFVLKVGP